MPTPNKGESKDDYLSRCIPIVIHEGTAQTGQQAAAICHSKWNEAKSNMAAQDGVSFDYDGTLSTKAGKDKAKELISQGKTVYIVSARNDKEGMLSVAKDLGIPDSRVFATGSNVEKVKKVKELGVKVHYDDNKDVIYDLKGIGRKIY
jgi:hypothetical protein